MYPKQIEITGKLMREQSMGFLMNLKPEHIYKTFETSVPVYHFCRRNVNYQVIPINSDDFVGLRYVGNYGGVWFPNEGKRLLYDFGEV